LSLGRVVHRINYFETIEAQKISIFDLRYVEI